MINTLIKSRCSSLQKSSFEIRHCNRCAVCYGFFGVIFGIYRITTYFYNLSLHGNLQLGHSTVFGNAPCKHRQSISMFSEPIIDLHSNTNSRTGRKCAQYHLPSDCREYGGNILYYYYYYYYCYFILFIFFFRYNRMFKNIY